MWTGGKLYLHVCIMCTHAATAVDHARTHLLCGLNTRGQDVCNMQTLLPFTHIYMFDKGFAPKPRRYTPLPSRVSCCCSCVRQFVRLLLLVCAAISLIYNVSLIELWIRV